MYTHVYSSFPLSLLPVISLPSLPLTPLLYPLPLPSSSTPFLYPLLCPSDALLQRLILSLPLSSLSHLTRARARSFAPLSPLSLSLSSLSLSLSSLSSPSLSLFSLLSLLSLCLSLLSPLQVVILSWNETGMELSQVK